MTDTPQAVPEKLEKCPLNEWCRAGHLYKIGDTIFTFNDRRHFVLHTCLTRGAGSEKPEVAYIGKWYNKRTNATRWTGPVRMPRSTKLPPPDGLNDRDRNDWEFQGTWRSALDWEPMGDA